MTSREGAKKERTTPFLFTHFLSRWVLVFFPRFIVFKKNFWSLVRGSKKCNYNALLLQVKYWWWNWFWKGGDKILLRFFFRRAAAGFVWVVLNKNEQFLGFQFQGQTDFVASLLEVFAVDQSGQIQSDAWKRDKNRIKIGQFWVNFKLKISPSRRRCW